MRLFFLVALSLFLVSVPVVGDEAREPTVVHGADLPSHFGVQHFFDVLLVLYRADEAGEYRPWIRYKLGIEEPRTVEILTRATLLAASLREETLEYAGFENDPAGWELAKRGFYKQKARDLGEIYWPMLANLRSRGVDVERIEAYIEEEVRPGQSLSSSNPDSHLRRAEAEAEFLAAKGGAQ